MTYLKKVTKLLDLTNIYLPDDAKLTPTHTGALDLHPSLLEKFKKLELFPVYQTHRYFPLYKPMTRDAITSSLTRIYTEYVTKKQSLQYIVIR